jgi:hypothetical protein
VYNSDRKKSIQQREQQRTEILIDEISASVEVEISASVEVEISASVEIPRLKNTTE